MYGENSLVITVTGNFIFGNKLKKTTKIKYKFHFLLSAFPFVALLLITLLFNSNFIFDQNFPTILLLLCTNSYHPFGDETSIFAPFCGEKEDEKKFFFNFYKRREKF